MGTCSQGALDVVQRHFVGETDEPAQRHCAADRRRHGETMRRRTTPAPEISIRAMSYYETGRNETNAYGRTEKVHDRARTHIHAQTNGRTHVQKTRTLAAAANERGRYHTPTHTRLVVVEHFFPS